VGGHSPADAAQQNRHDRPDASISSFHHTRARAPPLTRSHAPARERSSCRSAARSRSMRYGTLGAFFRTGFLAPFDSLDISIPERDNLFACAR
jgi:hypothetical protein